jgi:hypothetical protein
VGLLLSVNGIDLSSSYVDQRGDVYLKAEGGSGDPSNPAIGVMVHMIFEQNAAPALTLSPKVDREKALALLPSPYRSKGPASRPQSEPSSKCVHLDLPLRFSSTGI